MSFEPPAWTPPPPTPKRIGRVWRVGRFLASHPTRRAGWNWLIWAVAALIVIGLVSPEQSTQTSPTAAGGAHSESATSTPATPSSPAAEDSTPATTAGTSSTEASAASSHPGTATGTATSAVAKPRQVAPTGGYVVTSGGAILPDRTRTPGAVNPGVSQTTIHSTICVPGWTSTVRPPSSYTTSLKQEQLATGYAYHGDTNTGDYEEDHLISLELGGAPRSELNLWPEPYNVTDGARTKDQVENRLHQMVCSGTMTLAKAQQAIASNWFTAYQLYVGTAPAPATTTYAPPRATSSSAPKPVPASALTCSASMSNPSPSQYSTTDVIVRTGVGGAQVSATAHYKSTDTTNTGTAASNGTADIPFRISRATVGYTVTVDVSVTAAGATRSCTTSFTPQ